MEVRSVLVRPALLLSAVCLGWGTIPLVAGEVDLPAAAIVFSRVWIAAAGLAMIVALARPAGPPLFQVAPLRCVATGVVLAAHWTAMFAAYDRAPDATVIFLIFLAPVGIAVIEQPDRRLVVALAIAVAGFALVAGPTIDAATSETRAGVGFAAVSGALFVALVLMSKPLAEVYGGLRLTLIEMIVAGVALLPIALTTSWDGGGAALPWLATLGLVHTAVGVTVYLRTLARLPATEVGILGYLEPVGVVLFAWLLVGERPTATTIVGGAVVVAAGALAITTTSAHSPSSEVAARVPR